MKELSKVVDEASPRLKPTGEHCAKLMAWAPELALHKPEEARQGLHALAKVEDNNLCPVCSKASASPNALYRHYQEKHTVRDLEMTTTTAHQCKQRNQFFAKLSSMHTHVCPARKHHRRIMRGERGQFLHARVGPPIAPLSRR